MFPVKLAEYSPAGAPPDLAEIYESLDVQASYAVGTAAREAFDRAYGDAQRSMLIDSGGVLAIAWNAVACWRDIKVKDIEQVKGRVI